MQNKNAHIVYIKINNKRTKIYVRRIDPNLHLRMDMRFHGEKILTVRFCFLERRRHTHIYTHGGRGETHIHIHRVGGGESKCAEAKVIKCPHLIILLYYFLYVSAASKHFIMRSVVIGQKFLEKNEARKK